VDPSEPNWIKLDAVLINGSDKPVELNLFRHEETSGSGHVQSFVPEQSGWAGEAGRLSPGAETTFTIVVAEASVDKILRTKWRLQGVDDGRSVEFAGSVEK